MLTIKPVSNIREVIEDIANFVAYRQFEQGKCITRTNITTDGGYTTK
jgi:hypothetical protein